MAKNDHRRTGGTLMSQQERFCFIGAGSMAEAILCGLLHSSHTPAENIHLINRQSKERLWHLQKCYNVVIPEDKEQAVTNADTVVFAVKPKDIPQALQLWRPSIHKGQKVISVAAGISTSFFEQHLPEIPVIRAMPNTSGTIGRSATAICGGTHATPEDLEAARDVFSAIGSVVQVEEKDMDTVTGLSGSGPAYIYYLAEALEQAGVTAGLTHQVARHLTLQTLLGAAHMLLETGEDPAELRRKVTSPGGTTMAGINTLANHGFHKALIEAVHSAKQRSEELAHHFTDTP
ncbi:pyrroline-5-carboxylate reductase [Kroppenstedtia pulmonis]|nr:pyrroline-5-carboxylate reductase [Kroppenstedtia pulmonis]